ncbi:MAG: SagB/ThcOx family dehydrogenase [Desulfobacterales bacterium]|jgi:SagB-type dehydrogenase family enzyme
MRLAYIGVATLLTVAFLLTLTPAVPGRCESMSPASPTQRIVLPDPRTDGDISVEKALQTRRSVRSYKNDPLDLVEISQLVWSAQGITTERGFRTAPSAGALYPLELYVIAGRIENLPSAIYKYSPRQHALINVISGDKRTELSRAALRQGAIRKAPAVLLFCAVYERTTGKYGHRGIRYVHMEVGHAAQNVCLQAIALGLRTAVIGAFRDDAVKAIAQLPAGEQPLYFVPVGR